MQADTLPLPWKAGSAAFCVQELIADLAGCQKGSARHDLLTALRHARARADHDPWGAPEHVRYAQAVLEIAVEWSMPAVERWAVAWLAAAGGSQLRLRWSSRSRDGRTRRDGLAPSPVAAIAAGPGRVIIGCQSGYVAGWTDDAGLSYINRSEGAVWAIASRDDRVFAAGEHGHFVTDPQSWTLPSLREQLNAVVEVAAIGPEGDVACGDIAGTILVCPQRGNWIQLRRPGGGNPAPALALSFDEESAVWAAWEDGLVTEIARAPRGEWQWRRTLRPRPGESALAAAFDGPGRRLAVVYRGGEVSVVDLPEMRARPAWSGDDVPFAATPTIAWSPGGLLALSGRTLSGTERLLFGQPDQPPESIHGEGAAGRVAFLDDEHLVTAQDRDITDWAVREAGSEVPDSYLREAITAVAVDPLDPSRALAGTKHGRLLRYDDRGEATAISEDGAISGQVHELARVGDDWLVAAQGGAYRLPPAGKPVRLPVTPSSTASYLCLSVASTGQDESAPDGAYACHDEARTLSGTPPLTFASAVRDICSGADGTMAAIDEDGTVRVRGRAGDAWSPPDPPPRAGGTARSGWRLLAASARSVTVWNPFGRNGRDPDGEVLRLSRYGQDSLLCRLPSGVTAARAFDGQRILMARPEGGVGLAEANRDARDRPIVGVNARATAVSAAGRRIVVAAEKRISGYDVMEPPADGADGIIHLTTALTEGKCRVTLADDQVIELDAGAFAKFRGTSLTADLTAGQQSALVEATSRIGDQIWRGGLDLAIDQARGDDPDRPVRLEWSCDGQTDDLPWELVHPSLSPLGWFAEPPVTSVRRTGPGEAARPGRVGQPSAPMTRYRMLVIRGTGVELDSSNEAYTQTSRRTRLTNVTMLSPRPVRIGSRGDLGRALERPADILQVWAHCGPAITRFGAGAEVRTNQLADLLAPRVSRLAVIVGCRSGAIGRALVERGVAAVVAMRVQVYSRTIQPLVADLMSLALGGMPIDLAFAQALRSYVLTGQPGAAAVPILYLAAGSNGDLFG
jgi:hypothetical protein